MSKAADLALGKIAALKTALIEFTDGDDAIAVADAGVVTLLTTAVAKSEGGAVTTNITQGLCKAWVHIASPTTSANAAITLADSFNTTSMTDNGTGAGRAQTIKGETFGHTGGLRGHKGSQYEGGHRVPFILNCSI